MVARVSWADSIDWRFGGQERACRRQPNQEKGSDWASLDPWDQRSEGRQAGRQGRTLDRVAGRRMAAVSAALASMVLVVCVALCVSVVVWVLGEEGMPKVSDVRS